MSTLQVSNLHFESTGNNRLQYTNSSGFVMVGGGSNVAVINSSAIYFPLNLNINNFTVNTITVSNTITGTDMTLSGNLIVSGSLTYVNTTTLNIGDNIITLNADLPSNTTPSENSGFEINRGSSANVQLRWNETTDIWQTTSDGTNYYSLITSANTSNASVAGIVTVVDSITNTSILTAASANSVKNAYDRAIDANTRAASAQSAAISAYSNAVSDAASDATSKAATAYSNAITFASNATNINTGTLAYARIPANIINTTAAFTISGVHTYSANIILGSSGLSANGSFGTTGQALYSNGTATYWNSVSSGVTQIIAANGLNGGTITSTGNVSVLANTGIVVNTSGVFVNATYINTISSNSATYANASITNTFTVGTGTYFIASGNVGIGNSAPAHKLSVNGPIWVSGGGTILNSNTSINSNLILGSSAVTVGLQANGSYGSAGNILTSNGSATYWRSAANTANNIAGGSIDSLPYQMATNLTGFISAPSLVGSFLRYGALGIEWDRSSFGYTTSIAGNSSTFDFYFDDTYQRVTLIFSGQNLGYNLGIRLGDPTFETSGYNTVTTIAEYSGSTITGSNSASYFVLPVTAFGEGGNMDGIVSFYRPDTTSKTWYCKGTANWRGVNYFATYTISGNKTTSAATSAIRLLSIGSGSAFNGTVYAVYD